MRDVQITGLTPGCQDLSLTLDGHTISPRGVSGLTVEAGAGKVPQLTLDVLALDITEVGGQMEVLIPEEARELLMTLGWTPPAGEAQVDKLAWRLGVPQAPTGGGYQPYRNPENHDVYDEALL